MTLLRFVVAAGSGALLAALAPPLNLHWLHWVAYVPMFWALAPDAPRRNVFLGYVYGFVAAATIFHWLVNTITVFSNLPTVLAVIVLFLYSAVFGAPYTLLWAMVHPLRRRLGVGWIFAWPALQVVIEWLCTYLLLFPYNQGVTQYRVPLTWQIASLTGIYGVTYLLLFVNAVWAEALYRRQEGRPFPWGPLAISAGLVGATLGFGKWRFEAVEQHLRAQSTEVRIAQLQTSTTMEERMDGFAREGFDEWMALTQRVAPGSVDLVIWPEGACPYSLNADENGKLSRAAQVLGELAKQGEYELVVGGGTRLREVDKEMGEARVRVFNSVYWYNKAGAEIGHYDKMVPLPFGEYLPFGDYMPWLSDLIGGIGDFKAGTDPVVFDGVLRAATPICYEAILPALCRRFDSPQALINVTNDAWFGNGSAPHLHAMLAAIRATELGVPVIRSGYTGVSFVVEPHGAIHAETEPFSDVARIVTVRSATVPTLYAYLGDWFVALCGLGLVLAWSLAPRWGRNSLDT